MIATPAMIAFVALAACLVGFINAILSIFWCHSITLDSTRLLNHLIYLPFFVHQVIMSDLMVVVSGDSLWFHGQRQKKSDNVGDKIYKTMQVCQIHKLTQRVQRHKYLHANVKQ